MAEEVHGQEGAGTAAEGGKEQEGGFGSAAAGMLDLFPVTAALPFLVHTNFAWSGIGVGVLGLPFVVAVGNESQQVDDQQIVYE